MHGVDILPFNELKRPSHPKDFPYLFVEYNMDEFDHNSMEDVNILHNTAERTARNMCLSGYWGVLGRKRTADAIRTPNWGVNDVVENAKPFISSFVGDMTRGNWGQSRPLGHT